MVEGEVMPVKKPIVDELYKKFKSQLVELAKKLLKDIHNVPYQERYSLGKKIIPQGFSRSREFFDPNSQLSQKIQKLFGNR
jgi:hypothetical protein